MTFKRVNIRLIAPVAVVRLRDRWPDDNAVQQIREEVRCLLADYAIRHLVFDFGEVEFFDANLRGLLVQVARELAQRDGRLVLCSLPAGMREHPSIVMFGRAVMMIAETPVDAMQLLSSQV